MPDTTAPPDTFQPNLPAERDHPGRGATGVRGGAGTAAALAAALAAAGSGEVNLVEPSAGRWTVTDIAARVSAALASATDAGHLIMDTADQMRPAAADRLLISAENPDGNWHLWLVGAAAWTPRPVLRGRMRTLVDHRPDPAAVAAAAAAGAADPVAAATLAGGGDADRLAAAVYLTGPGTHPDPDRLAAAAATIAGASNWKNLTPATRTAANAALTLAAAAVAASWARRAAATGGTQARRAAAAAAAWSAVPGDLTRNITAAAALGAAAAASPPP